VLGGGRFERVNKIIMCFSYNIGQRITKWVSSVGQPSGGAEGLAGVIQRRQGFDQRRENANKVRKNHRGSTWLTGSHTEGGSRG